jgi:hypothetical protein
MNQSAIESITRSEIDIQIATAHRFPRSIVRFKEEVLSMATIDAETAESCFYVIPRAGKSIEGPSIRLMEIAASAWGNIRYGSRVVGEDNEFITSQGIAHDLEKNVSITIEVKRRITDSKGKRYGADMIGVTSMAGSAIARRNALLGVIPRAFINPIYDEVKKVAVGTQMTLNQKRENAIAFFGKMGITPDRIFERLEVEGKEDITLAHLETLIGLKTAIKDNEISIDLAFPTQPVAPKTSGNAGAFDTNKKSEPTVKEATDKLVDEINQSTENIKKSVIEPSDKPFIDQPPLEKADIKEEEPRGVGRPKTNKLNFT